jgi:tetratricopeptide (TPR) repeat protein
MGMAPPPKKNFSADSSAPETTVHHDRWTGVITFRSPGEPGPDPETVVEWPNSPQMLTPEGRRDCLLSQLVAGSKKEPKVLFYLVKLLQKNGWSDAALPYYQRLMQLDLGADGQFQTTAELGRELLQADQPVAAIRYLRAATKIIRNEDQETARVYAALAKCCNELKKFVRAECYCRHALGLRHMEFEETYLQLGIALEGQGRCRSAALVYVAAEKRNEDGRYFLYFISQRLSNLVTRWPELEAEFGEAARRFGRATDMGARPWIRPHGPGYWWWNLRQQFQQQKLDWTTWYARRTRKKMKVTIAGRTKYHYPAGLNS